MQRLASGCPRADDSASIMTRTQKTGTTVFIRYTNCNPSAVGDLSIRRQDRCTAGRLHQNRKPIMGYRKKARPIRSAQAFALADHLS